MGWDPLRRLSAVIVDLFTSSLFLEFDFEPFSSGLLLSSSRHGVHYLPRRHISIFLGCPFQLSRSLHKLSPRKLNHGVCRVIQTE